LVRKKSVIPEARTERRRSTRRTFAGTLAAGHLLGGGKKGWGFWESLSKEKAKKALADGETTAPIG
jgi:hypothetical protein